MNIDNQQNQPLALIPVEAIECTLERFQQEAADARVPQRMLFEVIGRSAGQPPRDLFGVVVNALETPEQRQASANWFALRDVMLTDPAQGQAMLAGFGDGVFFERVLEPDEPRVTTQLDEAPRVAMLAGGSGRNDTLWSLEQIFGADVQIVTTSALSNPAADPLLPFDVIYNAGQVYRPNRRATWRGIG